MFSVFGVWARTTTNNKHIETHVLTNIKFIPFHFSYFIKIIQTTISISATSNIVQNAFEDCQTVIQAHSTVDGSDYTIQIKQLIILHFWFSHSFHNHFSCLLILSLLLLFLGCSFDGPFLTCFLLLFCIAKNSSCTLLWILVYLVFSITLFSSHFPEGWQMKICHLRKINRK